MHCDNQIIISKISSKSFNEKKCMRVRHKYIRILITHGIISFYFVRLERNIMDLFTKGLRRQQVLESSKEMRLKPIN